MNSFLNPEKALKQLKLKENMVAADFGSGAGFWVIPLARMLEDGKVFAIDVLEDPLSALSAKIRSEKIANIETQLADVEQGIDIPSESCDLVLMTNLLFQADNREKVLAEGKRVLKKGGNVLVVDWKEGSSFGPKERVSQDEIKILAKTLSFKMEKEFEASPYHWAIILVK